MLVGTNLQYANSYNNRIILETIRLYGPMSRVGVARQTQLTAQTVTNITKKLMNAGLIVEDSRRQSGPGAPSILLRINESAAYSIGIDFDKDHLTVILVNFDGKICQKRTKDVHFPLPQEAIELMVEMVNDILVESGLDRDIIWGIGVGLPGPFAVSEGSTTTKIANPEALPEWQNVPVVRELESRLHIPVILENNASAAAIGEHWYGDGKMMKSFFYVYFGAGLGGGIVINGQLYPGYTGNAGELGYFPTPVFMESGKKYEHDHLGGYFNVPLLQKKLRALGYDASSIADLADLHGSNNEFVEQWLSDATRNLIPLILAVEYMFDPEAIFFGGRLPESILRSMLDSMHEIMPEQRIARKTKRPKYKIASAGIDAAALGVASLPLYTSFAPQPRLLMKQSRQIIDTFSKSGMNG